MKLRRRVPSGWARRAMEYGREQARQDAELQFARERADQIENQARDQREHGHRNPEPKDTQ